jgi:hypothetical protein
LIERETVSGDEVARIVDEHSNTRTFANGHAAPPTALVPLLPRTRPRRTDGR